MGALAWSIAVVPMGRSACLGRPMRQAVHARSMKIGAYCLAQRVGQPALPCIRAPRTVADAVVIAADVRQYDGPPPPNVKHPEVGAHRSVSMRLLALEYVVSLMAPGLHRRRLFLDARHCPSTGFHRHPQPDVRDYSRP
jgi:hypothetical protein